MSHSVLSWRGLSGKETAEWIVGTTQSATEAEFLNKMMQRWFFVSALVALGTWGCSSSTQSADGSFAGGAGASASAGHGGTHVNNGGSTAVNSGGSTSGNNGGSSDANGGDSGTNGGASNGGDSGTNGGASNGGTSSAGNSNVAGSVAGGGIAGATGTTNSACNNGLDDDGDGLIDGFDPECTHPLDNDEGSFATGIPGDNRDPKWQDCFFDGNSGAGDDDCKYATGCLTGDLPQTDASCKLSDACVKFCAPLTQNGCDCFGCCTVQKSDGTTVDITETPTCSLSKLDDTAACPRCVKNAQCGDTCGECELCLGKTLADLPAKCTPSAGTGGSGNAGGASGTGGETTVGGAAQGSGGSPATGTGGSSAMGGASATGGSSSAAGGSGATWSCDGRQVCGPNLLPCQGPSEYCSLGCCVLVVR